MFKPLLCVCASVFCIVGTAPGAHADPLKDLGTSNTADDITEDWYRDALEEDVNALLVADLQKHPLYLFEDKTGQLYRQEVIYDEEGSFSIEQVKVTEEELAELEGFGHRIDVISDYLGISSFDGDARSAQSSSTCPVPASFNLNIDTTGTAYGNMSFASTNRPPGTNTQWLSFEFRTKDYRGSASHVFLAPFWKDVLHGWGAILG